MKWPFISRAAFDIVLDAERRRADAEHENAQIARRELSDLSARYHMLRLQGAVVAAEPRLTPKPSADPVMDALNAACAGKDDKVRAGMLRQLKRDRAAGLKDDEIMRRIHRGTRPHDDMTTDPSEPAS